MMSSHHRRQCLDLERGQSFQQSPQTPHNPADEASEQQKLAENSREPLTMFPDVPIDSVLSSKDRMPVNEPHSATVETGPARAIEVAGSVDQANQESSERAHQVAENLNPTSQLAAESPETDDESPIWTWSMQRFAEEQPELYEVMEDCIGKFKHLPFDNWAAWLNNHQEESMHRWFRRCKAYLPSLSALKRAAMGLYDLDAHKLTPSVITGVFVAIELCFKIVDPSARDMAIDIILKVNGLINKWTDSEIHLQELKGRFSKLDRNLRKMHQIEENLELLYLESLKLISRIYRSGNIGRSCAGLSLFSDSELWALVYKFLYTMNLICGDLKSEMELAVKKFQENLTILDQIRILSNDPEPGHKSVRERTGIDNPESIAGAWSVGTDEFNSWLEAICNSETEKRFFWLKGSMGTGKTTMMCRIISYFEDEPIPGVRIVPYYCYASGTSKASKAPKHETIIRALCHQLAWNEDGSVANAARDLLKREDVSFTVKSTWEPLLEDLIACSEKKVVFAIDALDECESVEQYNLFLEFLRYLPNTPKGPYYLISSRPHVPLGDYFDSFIQLDATHPQAKQDMKNFITDQINSKNTGTEAQSIFFNDNSLRLQLEEALYDNAGGMFRSVEIWLSIFFPRNRQPIQREGYARDLLHELEAPKTVDRQEQLQGGQNNDSADIWEARLHKAYGRLWDINGDEQHKDLQAVVFKTVTGAFESLTPQQLLEAVRLDPAHSENGVILELDGLESLYYNFLKADREGLLNFQHLSAKLFVSQIKKGNSDELIFPELG